MENRLKQASQSKARIWEKKLKDKHNTHAPVDQWSCTKSSCSRDTCCQLCGQCARQTCRCVQSCRLHWTAEDRNSSPALWWASFSLCAARVLHFQPVSPPLTSSVSLHSSHCTLLNEYLVSYPSLTYDHNIITYYIVIRPQYLPVCSLNSILGNLWREFHTAYTCNSFSFFAGQVSLYRVA